MGSSVMNSGPTSAFPASLTRFRFRSSETIWEMTYSMTFHGGGGKKNRVVNTTLVLDPGSYNVRYFTDDSHAFNHWNTDPPDDPTMWGISVFIDDPVNRINRIAVSVISNSIIFSISKLFCIETCYPDTCRDSPVFKSLFCLCSR